MKQKILIPSLLIALLLMTIVMNGCGGEKTTETTPIAVPTIETPIPTLAPVSTPIIPPTTVPMNGTTRSDEITGSGKLDSGELEPVEDEMISELSKLQSYHAELNVNFSGNDADGQSQSGVMTFIVSRDNATQDTEMTISGSGSLFEEKQ